MMQTAFFTHPDCLNDQFGLDYPESLARLSAIDDHLIMSRLDALLIKELAPCVEQSALARVHPMIYLQQLQQLQFYPGEIKRMDAEGETRMSEHTLQAAYRASGAAVAATQAVIEGRYQNAFCAIRPPGHHAFDRVMGFCYFNHVAVAARYALDVCGLKRVAIIDFDAHHGNGTEQIFLHDTSVLFCNLFEESLFPFMDVPLVAPHFVHLVFPALTKGNVVREAIEMTWLPRLKKFKPQMIFISAGFDGHFQDEMSHLCLVEHDFEWITLKIVEIAQKYAKGRIVSCLEGGYHLSALARSVVAHLRALMGVV